MSNECHNCDAGIPPAVASCPYCGTITAHGRELERATAAQAAREAEAQQEREREEEQQQREHKRAAMGRASTFSLVAGIVGLVTCFLLVGSVLAVIMWIKVRRLARETESVRPTKATVGLVFGVVGLLVAGSLWIWVALDMAHKSDDVERLRSVTMSIARQKALTRRGACKLVQLELLEENKYSVFSAGEIQCRGGLQRDGERAVLSNIKILEVEVKTVTACLVWRGSTWEVQETRQKGACWSKPKPPVPPGSKAPASAPKAPASAPRVPASAPKAPTPAPKAPTPAPKAPTPAPKAPAPAAGAVDQKAAQGSGSSF